MEESSVGTLINEIVNVTMNGNVIEEVVLGDQFLPFLDRSGSLVFKGVIDLDGSVYFDTSQFANYVIEHQHIAAVDLEQQDQQQTIQMQQQNDRVIEVEKSIELKDCDNNANQIDHNNDAYLPGPNSTDIVTTTSCTPDYNQTTTTTSSSSSTTATLSKRFQDISTVPSCRPAAVKNINRVIEQQADEQLVPVPQTEPNVTPSQDPLQHDNTVEPPIGKGPFHCEICNKVFSKWPLLRRHKKEHLDEKIYRCEKCPMTFNYENNLSVHRLVHEAEATGSDLRCKLCSSKFSRLASLKSHLRIHEKEDNLVCQECGDEFPTKARLENHMEEHKPRAVQACLVHRCRLCGKTFTQAALLKDHAKEHAAIRSQLKSLNTRKRRTKPKTSGPRDSRSTTDTHLASTSESAVSKVEQKKKRICAVCNKRFQKPSQLARHERIHTGEKPFECKECGKRFNQKGTMGSHIQAMHKREKPYACDLCSCKFSQRGNLKAHVLKVHVPPADNEKVFRCEECCCVYRRLATLNNHIAKVHAVESTQTEEDASASNLDPNRALLQNVQNSPSSVNISSTQMVVPQQQLHPSQNVLPQVAATPTVDSNTEGSNVNGKSNSLSSSADRVENQATSAQQQQQPQQSSSSSSSSTIRKESNGSISEIKIVHTEQGKAMRSLVKVKKVGQVKWHLCPYCQKAFRKPSDLIRHIRVHTQERPYTCNICGKAFAVKSTLNTHVRTHCPTKELECRICHKRFSMLSSLKSHERLHTGVKPFPCMQCVKSFRTSSQRRVHFKIHSRNLQGWSGKRKLLRIGETSTPIELPAPLKITSDGLVPVPNRSASATSKEHSEGKFRPYKCKECPSAFKKSSHLKQHIRSHTGEKPYKCYQCFRSFVSSGVLKNHIKTHEKVRAFKCSICAMSFTTNGSLTRHMATHTNARPYVCPYCHKTFKTSVSCRKHIKTHRTEIVASISGNTNSTNAGLTTVTVTENSSEVQETEQDLAAMEANDESTTIHSSRHGHGLFDDHCPFDSDNPDSHYDDYATTVASLNVPLMHNEQVMTEIEDTSHQDHHNMIPIQHHGHHHQQQQVPMNDSINTLSRPPPLPENHHNDNNINNIMEDILQNAAAVTNSHHHQQHDYSDLGGDAETSVQLHYQISNTLPLHAQQNVHHHSDLHQHHHQMATMLEHHDPNSFNTVYQIQHGENVELATSLAPYMSQTSLNDGVNTQVLGVGTGHMQAQELSSYQYSTPTVSTGGGSLVHHHPTSSQHQQEQQQQQDMVTSIQNELENHHHQIESTTAAAATTTTTQCIVVTDGLTTTTTNSISTIGDTTSVRTENQPIRDTEDVQRIRDESRPISERIYNELTSQPNGNFRREDICLIPKMNECQFCFRAFKKRSDLQRHVRIHTGEKPFRCNVCGKSFRVKSTREAHTRTHEGGKTVSCHVCNNLFSTKSSLRVHMRLHTGAKPYPCPHCELSFRTSGHRKAHVASHFKSIIKESNTSTSNNNPNNNNSHNNGSTSTTLTTTLCTVSQQQQHQQQQHQQQQQQQLTHVNNQPAQYLLSDIVAIHSTQQPHHHQHHHQESSSTTTIPVSVVISSDNGNIMANTNGQLLDIILAAL